MKKGFTLIELLGVIIILALVIILTFPSIINFIKKGNDAIDDATIKLIYNATDMYIRDNQDEFPKTNNNKYCITIEELVNSGELKRDIVSTYIENNKSVQVTYNNKYNYNIVNSDNCINNN